MQTQLLLASLAATMAKYYMCYCPAWDSNCPKQTHNIQSVQSFQEAEAVVKNHLENSTYHENLNAEAIEYYMNEGHWWEQKNWKDSWGDMHEEFEKKKNKQGRQADEDEEWQGPGDASDNENDDQQWREQAGEYGNDQQWQKEQHSKGQWEKQDGPYGKGGYGKGKGGQGKRDWVSDAEQEDLRSQVLALMPPPPPAPGSASSSSTLAPIDAANPIFTRAELKGSLEELSQIEENLQAASRVSQAAVGNLQRQHLTVQTMRGMWEKRLRNKAP